MRIIVDGMGGDNAPQEIVKGAIEAARQTAHEIVLIGNQEVLEAELAANHYDAGDPKQGTISIVHASEVILGEDSPVKAARTKKDSSMVRGIRMIKEGEGDLFISAGNTGALLAGSLFNLGRIPGIDRPALASTYPIMTQKPALLVDAGANAECKASNLLEFGIMGSIYMERVLGRPNPRVGLVNNGTEEGKGTTLTKAAHEMLEKSSLINFVGNVEAREVPHGVCDVIVCDGFVGNAILKLTEGFALAVLKLLKQKFTEGAKAKAGALLLKNKMYELKEEFDYSEYGGAPFLGVRGSVIKMHGSSDANAVKNTILKGIPYAENRVVETIESAVLEIEEIINSED